MAIDLFATTAAAMPMRPWDYVRICREAAGLSLAKAAEPYWIKAKGRADVARIRADVERITADIERPGIVLRHDHLIDGLRRALPSFDPGIYRTLRDEPADRHPSICRGCGCTSWDPSTTIDGYESTITDGVCTDCTERAARRAPDRRAA